VKKQGGREVKEFALERALLSALSDDLALPLLQIKTALDLLEQDSRQSTKKSRTHVERLRFSADSGLQLIEAYRLVLRPTPSTTLPLEPIAIGSVLQDVAHRLSPYAKHYGATLEVDIKGNIIPALAHKASLSTALQCLGVSIIRAQAAGGTPAKDYRILLGAHRASGHAVVTGVFSNMHGVSDRVLRTARDLAGRARQPLTDVPQGATAGVLIADLLCSAMWHPLRAAAHRNLHGLATNVPVSKQLQFV